MSEKLIAAICLVLLILLAGASWMHGERSAAYLAFGLMALLVILFGYQAYRRSTVSHSGPIDPSVAWRVTLAMLHEPAQTFRYPRGLVVGMRWIAAVSTLFGPAIYIASSPRPIGAGLVPPFTVSVIAFLLFYVGYRACRLYAVTVSDTAIVVQNLMGTRSHSFESLGKVALLESGGRGSAYVLALYDKGDRPICRIDGVEPFQQLVALVKERAFAAGTPYRYRDMWGCWTR